MPAGIDLSLTFEQQRDRGLPRARGDRPSRGSTDARAPSASPCPRGSTLRSLRRSGQACGFPVPAGIDPPAAGSPERNTRLPRARGDRPPALPMRASRVLASPCPRGSTPFGAGQGGDGGGFPVPAGIDPRMGRREMRAAWLPRARGDRPGASRRDRGSIRASPCPRGSTLAGIGTDFTKRGFPVPAGIDPAT